MGGWNKIDIDHDKLLQLMKFRPTREDCAAFFHCSAQAIDAHIMRETGLKFKEFREQGMVHVRLSLIQKAIDMAQKGDRIMLIFCLKNLCGWNDNPTTNEQVEIPRAVISVIGQNTEPDKKSVPVHNG